jgi:two-component system KDP operon response regulator KdpE
MSSLRPNSILVVDDDPSLRKVLSTSLSMSGFVVEEARDGEDALARVQSDHFDVVLLDIIMPGIGGVEACRRIRAISPKIGIIMITVRDSDHDIVHALDAGANDYLVKPFRLGCGPNPVEK